MRHARADRGAEHHEIKRSGKHRRDKALEQRAPADAIHNAKRDQREDQVGEADERIRGEGALVAAAVAVRYKKHGAVIEDGVDAGDLLQHGDGNGKQQRAAKTAQPAGSGSLLCNGGANLLKLF